MPSIEKIIIKFNAKYDTRNTTFVLKTRHIYNNRYAQKMVVQAKMEIGQVEDACEQEADTVAAEIMQISEPRISRIKELFQIKKSPIKGLELSRDLEARINSILGGGQPLPESFRTFFESLLGYDLSQVRIHIDARGAELARALNARAFTVKQDVVFGAGQYAPWTLAGQDLLAHELVHVIQQTRDCNTLDERTKYIQCSNGGLMSPRFANDLVLQSVYRGQRLLRKGDKGPAVQKIQQALMDLGFPLPRFGADSDFGNETASSVMNYQRANGLAVDGIVGPITIKSLDAKFSSTPQPVTGFSFLLRAGETIRDRMVRCCNEALDQAGGEMGYSKNHDLYRDFISCRQELTLEKAEQLTKVRTSCAMFVRAVIHWCGYPPMGPYKPGTPMFKSMGNVSYQHPAFVPNKGQNKPQHGDYFFIANRDDGTDGHTGIFIEEIEIGRWRSAEGGGGDGTLCRYGDRIILGQNFHNDARRLRGWFDCTKIGLPGSP